MSCEDDNFWKGPLSAARTDSRDSESEIEQTNYWKRGKSRAIKRLRALSRTSEIARADIFQDSLKRTIENEKSGL
jgi:hypothetical protein